MQINKKNIKILGIDYGRSKIGLAISVGGLAEPFKIIRYKDTKILERQLKQVIESENIDTIVVGVSEGEIAQESKSFSISLSKTLGIPVKNHDETLTTQDAQLMSREAGISQKKRHEMEDAYAATIMLQNYIDSR